MKNQFKYMLTLALLLGAMVMPRTAWADTDHAENYFVISHDFTPAEPYVEFKYADYDFGGRDDAIINPEFGVIVKRTFERIRLATMPRCHDEMKRYNTEYGAMEVTHGGGNSGLRIVTMRYYPSGKGVKEVVGIYHTGWWDIDDDGGKGYDINETRDCLSNRGLVGKHIVEAYFNGAEYVMKYCYKYASDIKIPSDFKATVDVYYTESGKYLKTIDYPGFHNHSSVEVELPPSEFPFDSPFAIGAIMNCSRTIQVKNGSYNSSENDYVTVNQVLQAEQEYSRETGFTPEYVYLDQMNLWRSDNGNGIIRTKINNLYDVDVYSNDENTYLGRIITDSQGDGTFEDHNAGAHATYYILVPHKKTWKKRSYIQALARHASLEEIPFTISGEGTDLYPYKLNTIEDFNTMIQYVNRGELNSGMYWKLENDLVVDGNHRWSIGTERNPFGGVFDGNGHEITFNVTEDGTSGKPELSSALFGVLRGAEVKDLKISGRIVTDQKYAAGISCRSYGATITNCEVNTNIVSRVNGDGTHGGFVGVADNSTKAKGAPTRFNHCVFKGSISGANTHSCGGLVGWSHGTNESSVFDRCLNLGTFKIQSQGSDVIARNLATAINTYYLNPIGGNKHQAKQLTEAEKGVGLMSVLGNDYYYVQGRYPTLKTFVKAADLDTEVDGEIPNLILDPSQGLSNQHEVPNVDVLLKRQFKNGERVTVMLPFSLRHDIAEVYGTFYTFDRYDAGARLVYLTEVKGDLEANRPYILRSITDFKYLRMNNVTLSATSDVPDASVVPLSNGLVGTLRPITVPKGAYGYSAGDVPGGPARGTFVRVGDNVKAPAFCAYLWLGDAATTSTTLQAVFQDADGEVTGIAPLVRDDARPGIFLLDGRQVATPQRGINIINGKKVFVK